DGPLLSHRALVLQVPARALLEGDAVPLRCRGWQNKSVTGVRFYRDWKDLRRPLRGTELSLSPVRLNDTGRYHCAGRVEYWVSGWRASEPVTVTVH
ncbi:FCRLA protein, partial [Ifrita kowaldi]|nr:FCRLA protein [Ifrita kowaldi]